MYKNTLNSERQSFLTLSTQIVNLFFRALHPLCCEVSLDTLAK